MSKKISYQFLVFLTFLNSCKGDFDELKLHKYSDDNKKVSYEIIEKEFTEKDSLIFEKKTLKVFDNQNRIINENNSAFYFYNSQNNIDEVKSVYRRGGKTNILIYKYIYDKNKRLKYITHQFADKIDTIQYFNYNKQNQLIEKKTPMFKFVYGYEKNRLSEEMEFQNDSLSQSSKYKYDSKGNKIIKDWVFGGNMQMKTYYKYNDKNKLISERDSSITIYEATPNVVVESREEFFYDKNDSLIFKKSYDRVLSEKDFKLRRITKFEYKKM